MLAFSSAAMRHSGNGEHMEDDSTLAGDIATAMTAASGDSPTPEPSTPETPAASASADTTRPPAEPVQTPEAVPVGAPPEHRWPSILENARKEAAAEADQKWEQQYGWVKQHQRERLEAAIEFDRQFNEGDPIEALQKLAARLHTHEQHGPRLRSLAARTLAAARGQQTPAGDAMPEPDVEITDANGTVVGRSYSDRALQARDAWLTRNIVAEVERKFAPVVQTVEASQKERAAVQRQQSIDQFSTTAYDDAKTWLGMDDPANQKAVGEALLAMRIDGEDPRDVARALDAAYRKVVVPKLQQARLSDQVRETNLKAQVNTVSPTASTAGTPKSYAEMTTAEALKHEFAAAAAKR